MSTLVEIQQITLRNNTARLSELVEAYFSIEVTTLPSSRKVQYHDINLFIGFMKLETGNDFLVDWIPRLSQSFKSYLQSQVTPNGVRYSDRSINRILAHLRTFAKWLHKIKPFPFGNPMEKIKSEKVGSLLCIDRALTNQERNHLLDAADFLVDNGGVSKDRTRYKNNHRPKRKTYRPYRNRAIIYTLIETGMRRAAVTTITTEDVDFDNRSIKTIEKGAFEHAYQISKQGIETIKDYIKEERAEDSHHYQSDNLFLPAASSQNQSGVMHPNNVGLIWNEVCKAARVEHKTPHSARHAMGRHIIHKTGNVGAVQRQLGHTNPGYSMQYTRISSKELNTVLDER